jgi:hypothetical protein
VETPTADTRRRTLKESEAHEGMKPRAQASGGRRAVDTASSVGNDESIAGPGNPMNPGSRAHIKTLKSRELHERQHGRR